MNEILPRRKNSSRVCIFPAAFKLYQVFGFQTLKVYREKSRLQLIAAKFEIWKFKLRLMQPTAIKGVKLSAKLLVPCFSLFVYTLFFHAYLYFVFPCFFIPCFSLLTYTLFFLAYLCFFSLVFHTLFFLVYLYLIIIFFLYLVFYILFFLVYLNLVFVCLFILHFSLFFIPCFPLLIYT